MKNTRNPRATAWSSLVIIALGVPLACIAAAPGAVDETNVKVSYSDLNVDSREGAAALYSRLKRASRQACDYRPAHRVMSVREILEARQCYQESLDAAVQGVGNKALTRVHSS